MIFPMLQPFPYFHLEYIFPLEVAAFDDAEDLVAKLRAPCSAKRLKIESISKRRQ
jgi:hypothetical protein